MNNEIFKTWDLGDGTAMVALGGVSKVPRTNDKTKSPGDRLRSSSKSNDQLSSQELAVCKQMSISPEDYLQTIREEQDRVDREDSNRSKCGALDDTSLAVCRMMGIDHNEYKKTIEEGMRTKA